MSPTGGLVYLAAAAMLTTWLGTWMAYRPAEWFGKPAAMALLALAVALAPGGNGPARALVAFGLLCDGLGDVLLMLPRERLVPGIAAFLVGHLAYIGAWLRLGLSPLPVTVSGIVVAAAAAFLVPRFIRGVREQGRPRLARPIEVYVAVIGAMTVAACGTENAFAAAGALLFLASDGLFGWYHFVRPVRWGRSANIVLYQLGQLGIALATIPR